MSARRTTAFVTALLVVASVAMVPGAVSATDHLSIETTQGSFGAVHVTVNSSDGPVEGATVNVSAVGANETYVGNGSYETDANGSVDLPRPEQDVTVWVNATNDNGTVSVQVPLVAPTLDVSVTQHDDATATGSVAYAITGDPAVGANVTVTALDGSYGGAGEYVADANGTFSLPAPDETVTVRVEAEAGALTGETEVTLENQSAIIDDSSRNFGTWMAAYVHQLLADMERGERGIGHLVAGFAVENNPGNAPDHAGPPDNAGPPDDEADSDESEESEEDEDSDDGAGPPDHAGPPDDAGPPDHVFE